MEGGLFLRSLVHKRAMHAVEVEEITIQHPMVMPTVHAKLAMEVDRKDTSIVLVVD